jgi:hypothetical protein
VGSFPRNIPLGTWENTTAASERRLFAIEQVNELIDAHARPTRPGLSPWVYPLQERFTFSVPNTIGLPRLFLRKRLSRLR